MVNQWIRYNARLIVNGWKWWLRLIMIVGLGQWMVNEWFVIWLLMTVNAGWTHEYGCYPVFDDGWWWWILMVKMLKSVWASYVSDQDGRSNNQPVKTAYRLWLCIAVSLVQAQNSVVSDRGDTSKTWRQKMKFWQQEIEELVLITILVFRSTWVMQGNWFTFWIGTVNPRMNGCEG